MLQRLKHRTRRVSKKVWHQREELAGITLLVFLVGMVMSGGSGSAATYTFSQTFWSGGLDAVVTANHADNQSGWLKYSSSSNISAINGGADLQLAAATSSFAETFTGTAYKDLGATTATWNTSSGQLEISGDNASDISAYVSGIFGVSDVYSSVAVGTSIYAVSSNGRFAKYNSDSDTVTDLTFKISSFWGSVAINDLAYDSVNQVIYLVGAGGKFANYAIGTDTATNLSSKISSFWSTSIINSVAYDSVNQAIYLGGANGKFAKYAIGTDTAANLSAKISAFWSSNTVQVMAYDPANQVIYMGGSSGKFAKYTVGTDTAADLTAKISGFMGTNPFNSMTYSSSNQVVYMGGSNGKFGQYAVGTDTGSDLTSKISSFWSSNTVSALEYDSVNQSIYLGGVSAKFAKYSIGTDAATNLSAKTTLTSYNTMYTLSFQPDVQEIYMGYTYGKFGKYSIGADSSTDISSSGMSNLFGSSGDPKILADTEGNALYALNRDYKKLIKYDLSTGRYTDLSSIVNVYINGNSGISTFKDMALDANNRWIYLAGEIIIDNYDTSNYKGALVRYDINSNTASLVLQGSVADASMTFYRAVVLADGSVYAGGEGGKFYKYSPQTGSTDLSSRISSFWGTNVIYGIAYDSGSNTIYLGGDNSKFAKYAIGSDTASDLSAQASAVLGASSIIYALAYDPAGGIYLGTHVGKLAKYDIGLETVSDLTAKISSFWSTNPVFALLYASENIYLGGGSAKLAKYSPASDSASNLSSLISGYWSSNHIKTLSSNGQYSIYAGGSASRAAQLSTGCGPCTAQSSAVDSTSQTITSATLTKADTPGSGSVAYYLSNNGGTDWEQVTPSESHTFGTSGSDLRFKVVLSGNATVQDLSVVYSYYAQSGYLISSAYDAGDPTSVLGGIAWDEDVSLPASTTVTVALRTASSSADLSNASWSEFTAASSDCSKDGGTVTCVAGALPAAMKDGAGDRWFQYRVSLTSSGGTPTVSAVRVTYVVNAPPQFNPDYPAAGGGGISAAQIATSTDPDWGKVSISYSVRDPDTSAGSNTPGYVTPSFEYNTGSGWTAVQSQYLSADATSNKSMDASEYRTYSAIWDAAGQLGGGAYAPSVQVRVQVNDNEAANNTATATSSAFALDAKTPAITTFRFDGGTGSLSFVASDDSTLSYKLSNDAEAFPSDWQGGATSTVNSSTTWTLASGSGAKTIYATLRDAFGNATTTYTVVPATPSNFDLRDVSNLQNEEWREFVSWRLYTATSGAAFARYEVYRSTNDTDYELLANITNVNQNYYTDTSVETDVRYYYKTAVVDTDGDRSEYSVSISDTVDGQGGTDFTPPTISGVAVAETQTSWATITWTTDEISNSKVEYSPSPSTVFGSSASNMALVTDHSLTLTGLEPNTTYNFRVKSSDVLNNEATASENFTFTTGSGPVISDVAIEAANDKSVTIVWNTDRDSNSYIVYSTNLSNLRFNENVSTAGSGGFVGGSGPLYQHRVTVSGLSARTTYYFYVKSAAAENGYETIDNKSGNYYTFNTTYDAKAPVISSVSAPIIAQTSASIVWTTDELANGKVDYGKESGIYNLQSDLDPPLSIYHIAALSGLEMDTRYYFRVTSADAAGNSTSSEESYFRTAAENEIITITTAGGASPPNKGDTTAPVISGVEVKDVDSFNATIVFSADEEVTAFIPHGPSPSYGVTAGESAFKRSHSVKLSRLRPGTTYNFRVQAVDKAGNSSASANSTFQTKFAAESLDGLTKLDNLEDFQSQLENLIESTLPSLVPPVISDIEISDVGDKTAVISWATNVKTYGSVSFSGKDGFDAEKDAYVSEMSDPTERTKAHKVTLTNLEPGTKYNFQIKSFVLPGVTGKSRNRTFTTSASKIEPQLVRSGNDGFTITWKTPVETTSYAEYKNLKTGKVGQVGEDARTMAHVVEVKNLESAATYSVRVFGYDKNGILVEGAPIQVSTKQDREAPEISGVSISNAFVPYRPNQLQTLISWKTNEPANSIVSFEEGVGVLEKLANTAGAPQDYTTQHTVILSSFKPGTVYRVKIVSVDQAGNEGEIPIRTIITPSSNESVFDVILKNFEDSFGFLKNLNQ